LLGVPSNPEVCPNLSSLAVRLISVPVVSASEDALLGGPPGGPLGSSAGSMFLPQTSLRNSSARLLASSYSAVLTPSGMRYVGWVMSVSGQTEILGRRSCDFLVDDVLD
jgi:hypothetical protein